MLGNLKLVHKGLLLISIPLLLQIAFFVLYSQLLSQSENLTVKEQRSKNVIGRCNWLSTLILCGEIGALSKCDLDLNELEGLLRYSQRESRSNLNELRVVLVDTPEQAALVDKAILINEELISGFTAMTIVKVADTSTTSRVKQYLLFAKPKVEQLNLIRHQILKNENDKNKLSTGALSRVREQKQQFIGIGIAFDVLIGLALFLLFTSEILHRLYVLMDNTRRFAERKPLNESINGNDEVAQLDKSFHAMASRIREAEICKQQYLQMISHDLRTPLTSVLCCLELLAIPDYNLSPNGCRQLRRAEGNLRSVLRMINEILDIERLESGAFSLSNEIIQSDQFIQPALLTVEQLAKERKIVLKLESTTNAEIWGDAAKLERVMVNLLSNAIKFSHEGGTIRIVCRDCQSFIRVEVHDCGRGIPKDFIDKVFDRFQQVEISDSSEKKGSGLGLAICKAIIEAHCGTIGLTSEYGKGSCFWFELPIEISK